ncbi:hypothetical protein [Flavobacterium gilvum]|uniref:Lipoprotein n=1 Tax=Flavobacterium gilvum TaxID=1492737 RepID=A0AAC9N5V6_9FLAO|nr:hypothetical protein [Flavobacterium gilvum]AOW08894.1 hypothetical protein EM308_04890 [Flavobacterium gilvum]
MKRFILASIIAFGFASCSSNNDDDSSQNVLRTTKVETSFGNSFLQPVVNNTGKNVVRGTIPVAIDQITVIATNTTTPSFPPSTTVFDLVANGTAGAEQKYFIDGIASGTNSFTANAITNGPKVSSETVTDDATAKNIFAANKATIPYAKYTATTSAQIVFTSPKVVTFNMGTSNGKLNTYVYTGPTLSAINRKVTVKSQKFNADGTPINVTPQTYDITGSNSFVSSWSDELAIAGSYRLLDISVYAPDGITVETTTTQKIIIKASTTVNTTIAITKDGITTSEDEATFVFPAWIVEGE